MYCREAMVMTIFPAAQVLTYLTAVLAMTRLMAAQAMIATCLVAVQAEIRSIIMIQPSARLISSSLERASVLVMLN